MSQKGAPPEQSEFTLHPTHEPLALQTLPPLSLHAVPRLALAVPQVFELHVLVLHSVVCAGQSEGALHWTHPKLALHTWLLVAQLIPVPGVHDPPPLQDPAGV